MKYLALLAVLAMPVQANVQTCDYLGDLAYHVAIDRDKGVSRREMRSTILQKVDQDMQTLFLGIVDIVYMEPGFEPELESEIIYESCLEELLGDSV